MSTFASHEVAVNADVLTSVVLTAMMLDRVIIVPRWAGGASSDWYPSLCAALSPTLTSIRALDLPSPQAPTIDAWVGGIEAALAELDDAALARTLVIGHSVGCRALLHALARQAPGRRVGGLLLVAAWWTIDSPWPTIIPWIETPTDLDRVRGAAPPPRVLLSDNDPFTADFRRNRARWEELLGASVTVVAGARHFNGAEEPAVAEAVADLLAGR